MLAWTPSTPPPPTEPQPGTEPWDDTKLDDLDYGDEPADPGEEEEEKESCKQPASFTLVQSV